MNIFEEVYARLDALPPEERVNLLHQLLPPQELFARMDGTRFTIRKHGLRIFDTSTLLTQAGIPEDDPRNQVFRELRGGLVDRHIPDTLRAVAARTDTVCVRSGAIQVWEGGRKAWWVPVAGTSRFEQAVRSLISEFEDVRDRLLLDDYDAVHSRAEQRWSESCLAAWHNLEKLGRGADREAFLASSMATFARLFPSRAEVRQKMHIELASLQRALPAKVERILADLRTAEREKLEAEAAVAREQLRLTELETRIREAEMENLERERRARDRLLKESLDPQIEQAKEILLQAQASLMRVAEEIFRVIEAGGAVSPATMRSWNRRIEALSVLARGNVPLEEAIDQLKRLKEDAKDPAEPDPKSLEQASQRIQRAFNEMEHRAAQELHADQIWQLMRAGRGDDALQQVARIRNQASNNLSEVDALWQLLSGIAAQNELLAEEGAEPVEIDGPFVPQEVVHVE
jgi:hypothetical protein